MTDIKDITKKSDAELVEFVAAERDVARAERFKDAFSRKAGTIHKAKLNVARALTELAARRRNETKQ